jgi:hypothetical protein
VEEIEKTNRQAAKNESDAEQSGRCRVNDIGNRMRHWKRDLKHRHKKKTKQHEKLPTNAKRIKNGITKMVSPLQVKALSLA